RKFEPHSSAPYRGDQTGMARNVWQRSFQALGKNCSNLTHAIRKHDIQLRMKQRSTAAIERHYTSRAGRS
ncbi:MAG: hypothetical protein ACWGMY_06515, partial [Hyphomicrobiaceae bacterium]